ncbi:MAG: hypothetical protein V3U75_05245 [Methylococcaceae bacterium]
MNLTNRLTLSLILVLFISSSLVHSSPTPLPSSFWSITPPAYYSGNEFGVPRSNPSHTNTAEGLQFTGNGYRSGSTVYSIVETDFSKGGDIYFTWKASGGEGVFWGEPCTNCYLRMDFGIGWFDGSNLQRIIGAERMTINHAYAGSRLILADEWYFSHIKIFADKQFTAVTSTGNYDDQGGSVFLTDKGHVSDKNWQNISNARLYGSILDSYGASNAKAIIGNVRFKTVSDEDNSIVVSDTLDFHCPIIDYQEKKGKSSFYSATFEYLGVNSNDEQLWKLKSYEVVEKKPSASIAAKLQGFENNMLKISSGKRGQTDYWADFEFIGNNGVNGALVWKLVKYGVN